MAQYLPKTRQTLTFAATFSTETKRLAESYLLHPILVEVAWPNATATNVEQRFDSVSTEDKRGAVLKLIKGRALTQAITFVKIRSLCCRLAFKRSGRADRTLFAGAPTGPH